MCNVATALTACGIETLKCLTHMAKSMLTLQQRLPLAVLKPQPTRNQKILNVVATALTACGIETNTSKLNLVLII